MDPFSISVGAVGLIDVGARLVHYLKDVKRGAAVIDQDLEELFDDSNTVLSATRALQDLHRAQDTKNHKVTAFEKPDFSHIWENVGLLLPRCEGTINSIQELLASIELIQWSRTPKRLEGLIKVLRKNAKEEQYLALRRRLGGYQTTMLMLLSAIQTSLSWENRSSQDLMAEGFHREFDELNRRIEKFRPLLESELGPKLRGAFNSARNVASLAFNNKYFDTPQSVSSIFTGRERQLQELNEFMFDESIKSSERVSQKRFVIYGLGGSGKTQFCCKFAQDYRQRFWGVFSVDGSSEEHIRQSFSNIAKNVGLEPNESAAKNWLSLLADPWLLIVDNADDPQLELNNYFPSGEGGHILITTRNPSNKIHGTVGTRFYDFNIWESQDASSLLLKAADQPLPWAHSVKESASRIANTLGDLPLALVVAGRTIMKGLCSLSDYLIFYKSHLRRIRVRAQQKTDNVRADRDPQMRVYASCEMMYQGLINEKSQATQDAIDLLNILSFLGRENVTMDLLIQGVTNPRKEQKHLESERTVNSHTGRRPRTWGESFSDLGIKARMFFYMRNDVHVLPNVFRLPPRLEDDYDVYRLLEALSELRQRSLIMYNADNTNYSMHPIVHTWVRERPEMKTIDQAVWCEVAATLLSQAILLPPLATKASDENFRRDLLPHIVHVRRCKEEIHQQFARNQGERKTIWPILKPVMTRARAVSLAKYSLVYAQCGLWTEAETLQTSVWDYFRTMLGKDHAVTIRLQLALAGTYWQLGQGNKAAELQEDALKICDDSLVANHRTTLNIMDSLAVSRWMQGRYKEALELHQDAIEGYTKTVGPFDEDTARAKDHLARVLFKYYRFDEARHLHQDAAKNLRQTLGADHLDTLAAEENLAMTHLEIGEPFLITAHELMDSVVEKRKAKLGKEHPYTLLAMLNLARIKAAEGYPDQAEDDIRKGLLVAYRNLGSDHIGVLYARMYLGDVLVKRERLQDADEELHDVIERQKNMSVSNRRMHPDCIMAMYIRADCLRLLNRHEEGVMLCDEAIQGLKDIGGHEHPLIEKIEERRRAISESGKSDF